MTYKLDFHEKVLKEWRDLDKAVQKRLKDKLAERLEDPRVPAAKLSGHADRYKIKLMNPGIRLVYEVHDGKLVVCVLAVGKRERSGAYLRAAKRTYRP